MKTAQELTLDFMLAIASNQEVMTMYLYGEEEFAGNVRAMANALAWEYIDWATGEKK